MIVALHDLGGVFVKKLTGIKPSPVLVDGTLIFNDLEKPNSFNNFFSLQTE